MLTGRENSHICRKQVRLHAFDHLRRPHLVPLCVVEDLRSGENYSGKVR